MIWNLLYVYIVVYVINIIYSCVASYDPKFGRIGTVLIHSIYGLVWPVLLVLWLFSVWSVYVIPWVKSKINKNTHQI